MYDVCDYRWKPVTIYCRRVSKGLVLWLSHLDAELSECTSSKSISTKANSALCLRTFVYVYLFIFLFIHSDGNAIMIVIMITISTSMSKRKTHYTRRENFPVIQFLIFHISHFYVCAVAMVENCLWNQINQRHTHINRWYHSNCNQ